MCAEAAPAAGNLPDIPSADDVQAGHFGLDGERVELGYATRQRTWGARLDEYLDFERSLTLDYGTLLTDKLGAGAALRQGSAYSDLWVNGIYAPERDVRLRLAGGQLRANDGAAGAVPNPVQQNSVLFGARRAWDGGLISGVGMTAYAVEANDAAAAATSGTAAYDDVSSDSSSGLQDLTGGRQQGHVLNLSLRPTAQSKLDLWREHNRLTYYSAGGGRDERELVASRVRYSQYFDNCLRLQGGYSSSDEANRLDLSVGMERWHVSVSRVQALAASDTEVGIGYSVPLGGAPNASVACARQAERTRAFEPVIDTTVSRPEQFPRDPLTASGALE